MMFYSCVLIYKIIINKGPKGKLQLNSTQIEHCSKWFHNLKDHSEYQILDFVLIVFKFLFRILYLFGSKEFW